MIFIVTAVTLLTAVATAVYTLKEANAQTNMTNNTGVNSTGIKVSKVTNPATGVSIGKIQQLNNTSSGGGNMTNATQ